MLSRIRFMSQHDPMPTPPSPFTQPLELIEIEGLEDFELPISEEFEEKSATREELVPETIHFEHHREEHPILTQTLLDCRLENVFKVGKPRSKSEKRH